MAACLALALAPSAWAQPAEQPPSAPTTSPAAAEAAPATSAPASATSAPATPSKPGDDLNDKPGWAAPAEGESLIGALLRMVLVLGLTLTVIYLTLNIGLRKLMRLSPLSNAVITVHERVPLDPKRNLYLVEVAGEYLLVGGAEGQVGLVTKLDAAQAREALVRKQQAPRPTLKPFWERLTAKPPSKKDGGPRSSG